MQNDPHPQCNHEPSSLTEPGSLGLDTIPEDQQQEALANDELEAAAQDKEKKRDPLQDIHVSEPQEIRSQDELQQALERHAQWKKAVLAPRSKPLEGRANFSGMDLSALSFAGADLSGADLSHTNLAGADLQGANLTATNLREAKLMAADLRGARLTRAKVEGADFRGADLTGAILTGVELPKDNEPSSSKEVDQVPETSNS